MLGAIVGDIAGSIYEGIENKDYDAPFLTDDCYFTDDTVTTLCVAKALYECNGDWRNLSSMTTKYMRAIARNYPMCGFGSRFIDWLYGSMVNYNSYGNGSAMRISPVGWVAKSIDELKDMSRRVTNISHGHPEGIKGAEAIAVCIFLARNGSSKEEIKKYVVDNYYQLDFTIDEIRPTYKFDVSCQGSVPQAIECFLESKNFVDAVKLALSIGGDSDTIADMAGSIAEAYYGVPEEIKQRALMYLDDRLMAVYHEVEQYIYCQNK